MPATESLAGDVPDYRRLFDLNPHPMWIFDVQTLRFLDVNAAASRHYGYSRREFLELTLRDIRPSEDNSRLARRVSTIRDEPSTSATLWRHRKKDGTLIDVEVTSFRVTFMNRAARVVSMSDVTERLRAENTIRALLDTVTRAEEEERARIARELHDDTAQSLSLLLLGLRKVAEAQTLDAAHGCARELRVHVARAIAEIRRIARGLRPADLDALGLPEALRRLAAELCEDHDIVVDVEVFRHETFGDEAFWGDALKLHQAVGGEDGAEDGVGPGLTPVAALALGLKVDSDALPASVITGLERGEVDLESPATTLVLLKANAVVGVKAFFDGDRMTSIGIQCALCHSTVDDSVAAGVGKRLDGWANRDLDVGKIVALAPELQPIADVLSKAGTTVTVETVKAVLASWGPGKYDAELLLDGKAFQDAEMTKSAATLLPPAFGMAGVNMHTWTGFGSVTYWNAYVANTQMHGQGTFYDPRLQDADKYPVAAANDLGNVRAPEDLVTAKRKSASMTSRRAVHPRAGIAPPRCAVRSATRRAASTTMAASRLWRRSSTTTPQTYRLRSARSH